MNKLSIALLTLIAFYGFSDVLAGRGCKGISCGISGCCDPNTQICITPSGLGGSFCGSKPGLNRNLASNDRSKLIKDLWVKNIRTGFINITSISVPCGDDIAIDKVSHALSGLVINATVINGSSIIQSSAISQFVQPGRSMSVLLIHANHFKASRSSVLDFASAVAANKQVTAIPFCPIDKGNIITLTVSINGFKTPLDEAVSMTDGARLKTLAELHGAKLTIVLGKEDTMMKTYHWMVVMGDSTAKSPPITCP